MDKVTMAIKLTAITALLHSNIARDTIIEETLTEGITAILDSASVEELEEYCTKVEAVLKVDTILKGIV